MNDKNHSKQHLPYSSSLATLRGLRAERCQGAKTYISVAIEGKAIEQVTSKKYIYKKKKKKEKTEEEEEKIKGKIKKEDKKKEKRKK